jgi:hypothetical protein
MDRYIGKWDPRGVNVLARVTHYQSRPEDLPLLEQLNKRLQSLCELEEWPLTDKRATEGVMMFQPWEDNGPRVHARAAVMSYHSSQAETIIAILLLSIRGRIPRAVLDRYLAPLSKDCARCGVNLTMEGPCGESPPAAATSVIVTPGRGPTLAQILGTPETKPELWEHITLNIALSGHCLNSDCMVQTLMLLLLAHNKVKEYCQRAGREGVFQA